MSAPASASRRCSLSPFMVRMIARPSVKEAMQPEGLLKRPGRAGQMQRRHLLGCTLAFGVPASVQAQDAALALAMARARALSDEAVRAGDQAYGAVVVRSGRIVGEGPSRVVTRSDPTAHAEMEAIRDAARRLGTRDLSGCLLVSTARPCRMCEAAAGWARIERMVHGDALTDAGRPS
jgi:tRNA(Arg) A34 adenosine deaminase TadA